MWRTRCFSAEQCCFWGRRCRRMRPPKARLRRDRPRQGKSLELPGFNWSGYIDDRSEAGVEVAITKGFLQRGKSRLSGAVTNRQVIQLPLIVQGRRYSLNLGIWRADQMNPSEQHADMRIYFGRGFENLFNAGVRTPVHNNQSLRAANGHRNFAEFERAGDLRNIRDQKNARSDLRR